ncbi:baeRF12 domain-containing protein [Radicibacter daui]|uniref:baeRF12 domain-containing protein n=1 Tax=Radicibacter daui TaxID=3064829 RepID=UPI004046A629
MNLHLKAGSWIVVCDGARALFLRNAGDALEPALKTEKVMTGETAATRDIGTDRPGRAPSSPGQGRSAMEETDWHTQAEDRFLAEVVHTMSRLVGERGIHDLTLVGPPRALGVMRPHLPEHVRSVLAREVGKDLVNLPVAEIEAHLTA